MGKTRKILVLWFNQAHFPLIICSTHISDVYQKCRLLGLAKPIFAILARILGLFYFSTHRKYYSTQYLQFPKKIFKIALKSSELSHFLNLVSRLSEQTLASCFLKYLI